MIAASSKQKQSKNVQTNINTKDCLVIVKKKIVLQTIMSLQMNMQTIQTQHYIKGDVSNFGDDEGDTNDSSNE